MYFAEGPHLQWHALKFGITEGDPSTRIRVHQKYNPFGQPISFQLDLVHPFETIAAARRVESEIKTLARLILPRQPHSMEPPTGLTLPAIGSRPSGEWLISPDDRGLTALYRFALEAIHRVGR